MALDFLRRLGTKARPAGDPAPTLQNAVASALASKPAQPLPIAIDFGVGNLKVLQVQHGPTGPALVAAACLETPDDLLANDEQRLQFQIDALPKLVRRSGFKGKRAVCAIPAWQTMCKQLKIPLTDGVKLNDLIAGAIASQLNIDPAALVFRHIDVGAPPAPGASNKVDVICIATARELVERLMRAVMSARLEPVGMHSEFSAIVRSFEHVNRRSGDQESATLYVDIGAASTKLVIAHGTDLVFARVMEFGGRQLDALVVRQLKCELADARRERREVDAKLVAAVDSPASRAVESKIRAATAAVVAAALAPEAEERRSGQAAPGFSGDLRGVASGDWTPPKADLTEPLEILTDDIMHCLRYYAAQYPGRRVDKAVFVGGEARYRGLCAQIAKAIRLPAQMADPMARVTRAGTEPTVGVDLKQAQPGWAVALGMCLSPTDL